MIFFLSFPPICVWAQFEFLSYHIFRSSFVTIRVFKSSQLEFLICHKVLVTPRDYGFFLSENHVIEDFLKLFVC